jgi:4-amino-4-deoxy-L-arabinose transferase-like glycosyltransferase
MKLLPRDKRISLLGGLIWLVLGLWGLTLYPAARSDEAWFAAPAVSILQTGHISLPIFGQTPGMFESYTVWRGYASLLAGWFKLVGVGIAQARLLTLLATALNAGLLYWLAKQIIRPTAGVFAALFYLFSVRLLYSSHFTRPDIWVQTFGIVSWCLYWWLKTRQSAGQSPRWYWIFGFGCLITAPLDFYPLIAYFTAASASAYLWHCWRQRNWHAALWLLLGSTVGVLYYLAMRFLPDPLTTFHQMQSVQAFYNANQPTNHVSLQSYLVDFLFQNILVEGILGNSRLGGIEFAIGTFGLGVAIWQARWQSGSRWLLWCGTLLWVGFLLPYKGILHLVEFVPWLALLCSLAVLQLNDWLAARWQPIPRWPLFWAMLASSPLMLGGLAGTLLLTYANRTIDYPAAAQRIRQTLPTSNPSILAEGLWWWYLREDVRFTSDEYLRIAQAARPNLPAATIVADVLAERQVEIVILDEYFSDLEFANNEAIQTALRAYTAAHCIRLDSVQTIGYGAEIANYCSLSRPQRWRNPTKTVCAKI